MSRCQICGAEGASLTADDRILCDACDPDVVARRALAAAEADSMTALLSRVVQVERASIPCDGCGSVSCPTGGRCPDFSDLDWDVDQKDVGEAYDA